LRARLAAESERELGAPLHFGRLDIALFPPALVLFDAALGGPEDLALRAARAELVLDVAALVAGERDGDAVRAVEISGGTLRLREIHAAPGATLELQDLRGRVATGSGVDVRGAIVPRGSVELRSKRGEKPFESLLEVRIDGAGASSLAPWLAALRVGDARADAFRITGGELDGTVELSGAMVPTERAYAELMLTALDASRGAATLRGDVRLTLDLGGLRGTPGGVFSLDARDAVVASGPLRKAAGKPFTLSGVLSPRGDGAPGFGLERVRAAPIALDLDLGGGLPAKLRSGGSAAPPAAPAELAPPAAVAPPAAPAPAAGEPAP